MRSRQGISLCEENVRTKEMCVSFGGKSNDENLSTYTLSKWDFLKEIRVCPTLYTYLRNIIRSLAVRLKDTVDSAKNIHGYIRVSRS